MTKLITSTQDVETDDDVAVVEPFSVETLGELIPMLALIITTLQGEIKAGKVAGLPENRRKVAMVHQFATELYSMARTLTEGFDALVKTCWENELLTKSECDLVRQPTPRKAGAGRKPMTAEEKAAAAFQRMFAPQTD